ncbi:MAG: zincin-like metallopeptidase domain-containing protein [Patescibacteria group bacterium]
MKAERSFERGDVHARITDEIIKAIEASGEEYVMPWHQRAGGMPRNALTHNHYHGVNTLALWVTCQLRGYTSPYFATYRQWSELGAQVRRGEKASPIIYFKQREAEGEDEPHNDNTPKLPPIMRSSSVFNAEQVDGWQKAEELPEDRTQQLETVDTFISSLGAEVLYGGDIAAYSRAFDRISMPERRQFVGTETSSATESFYSVLLHEHVHWSGHPKRLNRDLSGRFGTFAYAMEELVAELGAAFLCADLGIYLHPRRDHAFYVRSWLTVLHQEKTAIFTASSAAQVACRYLKEVALEKSSADQCA